jgi:hypothetical protein
MSIRINGDNTAANPGITGTDTDTGLQFGTDEVNIVTGGTTRATVDSNGDFSVNTDTLFVDASADRVGIGTSSPAMNLEVSGSQPTLRINTTATGYTGLEYSTNGTTDGGIYYNGTDDRMEFYTGDTTGNPQTVIDSSGRLLVGTTTTVDVTSNVEGVALNTNSAGAFVLGCLNASANGQVPVNINRKGNDGGLIFFWQDGTNEGSITVSGSTVQLNGAHLSRWSQLPGGAPREKILRGTVLSNIDEMCEWAYDAEPEILWAEGDELPEGVNVGDVKTPSKAAGTEENEQLNRMKVSDVEGDKNVAGVFQGWDDDDDTYTDDFFCAMTGDFVIRIAQGVTVERGDLLMSAGDGTAKPQGDDIVRSKTIAKVTSTNVSCTYDDGSYCVPCVLMAC